MHFFSSISFVSRANSILGVFAFFVFCASFFVVSPAPLSAASFTGSIVGCGNVTVSNCSTADGRDGKLITGECSFCDVMDVIQKILNFLVFAVMIVATLLFCYAGVLYLFSAPSMGNIERAHKIFWNVAIGLVITLASWLIIDTVMKILYDDAGGSKIKQTYGPWNNILCPSRVEVKCEPTEAKKVLEFYIDELDPATTPASEGGAQVIGLGANMEEDAARTLLQNGGVGVKGDCPEGQSTGCVDLKGIKDTTLNYATYIKEKCPTCDVFITGGTEGAHSEGAYSHGTGFKIDLKPEPALNTFLPQLCRTDGPNNCQTGLLRRNKDGSIDKGFKYTDKNNTTITAFREKEGKPGDHWDISVIKKDQ